MRDAGDVHTLAPPHFPRAVTLAQPGLPVPPPCVLLPLTNAPPPPSQRPLPKLCPPYLTPPLPPPWG